LVASSQRFLQLLGVISEFNNNSAIGDGDDTSGLFGLSMGLSTAIAGWVFCCHGIVLSTIPDPAMGVWSRIWSFGSHVSLGTHIYQDFWTDDGLRGSSSPVKRKREIDHAFIIILSLKAIV
jgi:hypothetical protein